MRKEEVIFNFYMTVVTRLYHYGSPSRSLLVELIEFVAQNYMDYRNYFEREGFKFIDLATGEYFKLAGRIVEKAKSDGRNIFVINDFFYARSKCGLIFICMPPSE